MKIGVYGGSFNPPHNGHLMLACELTERLSLDKLIVIPSNISPQKSNNGNIDPVHRINMCKILFDDEKFTVSDCEIKRGGKSYTFDTLNFIRSEYKDAEIYLFMGSDMLLSFHSWYRYEDILSMCTLCAISREDDSTRAEMLRYSADILKNGKVLIFDVTPFQVSSSQIRDNIRQGKSCEGLLDGRISAYIKEHNLYE
ncbi:MAG: nicotinate (nicotinamide) nucleotide adenylyltransferase [Clostridia bacterium]|nr:nicotinate (nicotinamide) nucleotide adenylyltransferase [Clostridia bacterium]